MHTVLETIKASSRGRFVVSLVHRKQSVSDSMMFIPQVSHRSQKLTVYYHHWVGRVLSFFSSCRNWDSPNPSPAGECAPPPLVRGVGVHSLAREGVGGFQFRREGTYTVVLFIYTYFVITILIKGSLFLIPYCLLKKYEDKCGWF